MLRQPAYTRQSTKPQCNYGKTYIEAYEVTCTHSRHMRYCKGVAVDPVQAMQGSYWRDDMVPTVNPKHVRTSHLR
jgi:hypothetical protein